MIKTIHHLPLSAKFSRGLDHFAPRAELRRHLHVDESLLLGLFVCAGALLANAAQPVSTGSVTVKAIRCQGVAAPPALLLFRRLPSPVAKGTPPLCVACQAVAVAATPIGGVLAEPSGRQQLMALLADPVFLCWWMPSTAQPAHYDAPPVMDWLTFLATVSMAHTARLPSEGWPAQHGVHKGRQHSGPLATQSVRTRRLN